MCEYCEGDKPIYDTKWWKLNVENKYSEKELYIEFNTYGYESIHDDLYIDIKFCPMCGKKLK